jgi:hypothetical protein
MPLQVQILSTAIKPQGFGIVTLPVVYMTHCHYNYLEDGLPRTITSVRYTDISCIRMPDDVFIENPYCIKCTV